MRVVPIEVCEFVRIRIKSLLLNKSPQITYFSISSPKLVIYAKNFEMNYWDISRFDLKL